MVESFGGTDAMARSKDYPASASSGYLMLLVLLVTIVVIGAGGAMLPVNKVAAIGTLIGGLTLFLFVAAGFYMLQPNQAAAITLFGAYKGSDRVNGLRWTWPWMGKKMCRCVRTT